jgi:tetratricopeptide (TPR) repeat protein
MNLALLYARTGKTAEAARIYTEAVNRTDLSDSDYFAVGVGLFQASNYELAAQAFRKATAANPNYRDAHYNLAQAIFAQTRALEDAKGAASSAAQQDLNGRLAPLYEELARVSEQVLALDPNSRTAILVAAHASRGRSDVAAAASREAHKARTVALLQSAQDLPVAIENVKVVEASAGSQTISGEVESVKAAPGTSVALRFTLFGPGGSVLGTEDVRVTAPAAGAPAPFEATVNLKGEVVGWKYEVLN